MALVAIAADKGAPGVTTTALALASVWPNPVLLAECDPAGGDLMYRFPAADGTQLDPRRGLLSLAVAARRGLQHQQVWEHVQKIHGGLDVLAGVTNAEQGSGLNFAWGPLGKMLAALSGGDVIADCGRLGPDGPVYDLLAEASNVVLVTRPYLGDVIRLRDRAVALAAAVDKRGRRDFAADVLVIADQRKLKTVLGEIGHVLTQGNVPARLAGSVADDPKGAELLRGTWGGRLDKTMLIRSAKEVAQQLTASLPEPLQAPPGPYAQPQAPQAPQVQQPSQVPQVQQPVWQPREVPPSGAHTRQGAHARQPVAAPQPRFSPREE